MLDPRVGLGRLLDHRSGSAVKVVVNPLGVEIDVGEGESVLAGGWRAGLHWPSVCSGEGVCSTCAVEVVSSSEPLPPPGPAEIETLRMLPRWCADGSRLRLACQLRTGGDLVVHKIGVRQAEG